MSIHYLDTQTLILNMQLDSYLDIGRIEMGIGIVVNLFIQFKDAVQIYS